MPQFFNIKLYHWANNLGKFADGYYNSMINDKDSHIPSLQIMFTCTALHHAPQEWPKNKGVHPKASKKNLKRAYLIARIPSIKRMTGVRTHPAAVRKSLTSPGIADAYAFLMNTWYTLPES